ncbi:hypothetical protein L210DRAFT_3769191 [Boletus edulis BED1]|uniref:Uncharacterized protein n=1 Tax=Boletus edulis BED1 TaxID=1328754 RepID=A0AAD4B989_BOLED|nr:hypothetical protein L210DRAFT_3769191 [Boletus edulis BED1]
MTPASTLTDITPPGGSPSVPEDLPQDVPSSPRSVTHTDENEGMVITSIRATDIALGLRRLPAGFYTVVHLQRSTSLALNRRRHTRNSILEQTTVSSSA